MPFEEPVSFERFMEFCLYDPNRGYYRKRRGAIGKQGDYYTSPHTHRFFAETLAEAFAAYFRRMGCPRPFHIVELGAGEGVLGRDLLAALETDAPEVHECVHYEPIEISAGAIPGEIQGIVFSNEFFDALPVHRVRVLQASLREIYVRRQGGQLTEFEDLPSDPRILDFMRMAFREWREGFTYEVNLRMLEVLQKLDRHLRFGLIVTIDYGYDWAEYDSRDRWSGTLMCYRRHRATANPYAHIGEQDITAHVSFEAMMRFAERLGWRNLCYQTQRQFLTHWGLERRLLSEEQRGLCNPERLQERLGLKHLLQPGGISDTMKVLVQAVRAPVDGGA